MHQPCRGFASEIHHKRLAFQSTCHRQYALLGQLVDIKVTDAPQRMLRGEVVTAQV